jgi:hypothetical protein
MPRYIKIEGVYELHGEVAPENTYKGYFEVGSKAYTVKYENGEKRVTQYIVGGQKDGWDEKGLMRPSLGGLQKLNDGTGSFFFCKLANSESAAPLFYEFGIGKDGWKNKRLNGEWVYLDRRGKAVDYSNKAVATFSEVTRKNEAEYEEAQKTVTEAKEILQNGLPYIMKSVKDIYEQMEGTSKIIAGVDEEPWEYKVRREMDRKQAGKLSRCVGQMGADKTNERESI